MQHPWTSSSARAACPLHMERDLGVQRGLLLSKNAYKYKCSLNLMSWDSKMNRRWKDWQCNDLFLITENILYSSIKISHPSFKMLKALSLHSLFTIVKQVHLRRRLAALNSGTEWESEPESNGSKYHIGTHHNGSLPVERSYYFWLCKGQIRCLPQRFTQTVPCRRRTSIAEYVLGREEWRRHLQNALETKILVVLFDCKVWHSKRNNI